MQSSETAAQAYKRWILETARRLRAGDPPPATAQEVERRGSEIRERIRRAEREALIPDREKVPLNAQVLGSVQRDGYRIERLVFQTRPGVYATANAWVPDGAGRKPAVLAVHGHWKGARRDPVVQSRNIGLAKLGFFVLGLDAWGAGERGTRPGENEYHGGLLGASLWPVGTPLHGLQLHDNVRALDYLQTRPEVDPQRIGLTGASGGGNQTTHLSAFDPRVQCAVPVCSVGQFQDYLNAACCVDEVLLGGLTFAEEGDLLGSLAPRALMVITARKDVYHFGPESAGKVVERARAYFRARGVEERIRHVLIDSGHDYNQAMREAMYGWMRKWLKGEGDGSPTPEPPITPEDPESLRCYPGFRPGRVTTTVQWVRQRAGELAAVPVPGSEAEWKSMRAERAGRLERALYPHPEVKGEPDLSLVAPGLKPKEAAGKTLVVLVSPRGRDQMEASDLARALRADGAVVACPELRGCGRLTLEGQGLGEAIPDHNVVEWGLWIGRPLLGQWVTDIRRVLETAQAEKAVVVGFAEGALAALAAAVLEPRVSGVAALDVPASYVSDAVPHAHRMALFSPDLLHAGDIQHLAGLCAPRPLLLEGPVRLDGSRVAAADLSEQFAWTRAAYRAVDRAQALRLEETLGEAEVARWVLRAR